MFIETLVTKFAAKTFNERIFDRIAWLNEVQPEATPLRPKPQSLTRHFWTVIQNDGIEVTRDDQAAA